MALPVISYRVGSGLNLLQLELSDYTVSFHGV